MRTREHRQRLLYGERENHCNSNKIFREKVCRIDEKLAERYANHPALILWHISNEMYGICHCETCQASFRKWLQGKYKTIDVTAHGNHALDKAAGTEGSLRSRLLLFILFFEEAKDLLARHGHELTAIEEAENEPSLGNGGLGRLAACFLDSIATLGLCGDGAGLNYHDGLFYQKLENHKQKEEKNPWITPQSWLTDTGVRFTVPFGGFSLNSIMYDIAVPGYNGQCNALHLFDVDTVDESRIGEGISFDKSDIPHTLTLFLYPDDSDDAGRLLRVYQQYFLVSSTAQLILKELAERGYTPDTLHEHVAVQINDTHPTMIIPELIRLLTEQGMSMDNAVREVSLTCAYTNHTILAEALEKWPMDFMRRAVPQLVPIIEELDRRAKAVSSDPRVAILDDQDRVHMAHIDIHYGYSVNGVAALHTKILEESELRSFYELYPEKFNNKTNGITFRRWLLHCNQPLAAYIESLIGPGFKADADQLEKTAGLPGRSPGAAHPACHQKAEQGGTVSLSGIHPGHRAGHRLGVRCAGQAPA